MITTRMRLAAATVALVAAAPLAATGTAQAAPTAEREITIRGVEPKDGVFFVKGKVGPEYPERFAILQRKLKSEKKWSNTRKFRTDDASKYRERVYALKRSGIVCYRVKVKGTGEFETSYSGRVCIRTYRS